MNRRAFTTQFEGIPSSLPTKVIVCKAYNPAVAPVPPTPMYEFMALWDTGAEKSVITTNVANQLGIFPNGSALNYNANGSCIVNTYLVNIGLPNNVMFPCMRVSEGVLQGFDVLIGMDIIGAGDFALSCKDGKTKFTFQIPSTHDFDFVAESNVPVKPIVAAKTSRPNDLCSCGSGKKYKNCCGKK